MSAERDHAMRRVVCEALSASFTFVGERMESTKQQGCDILPAMQLCGQTLVVIADEVLRGDASVDAILEGWLDTEKHSLARPAKNETAMLASRLMIAVLRITIAAVVLFCEMGVAE